jgi:Na+/H+ antiporter NhaD/arsenite permease-like protein
MNSSTKKTDRFGLLVLALFSGLFVYAGVSKYGLLLAYLNVSGYLYAILIFLIIYKVNRVFDEKTRNADQHSDSSRKRSRFFKFAWAWGLSIFLIYVLFFVQPDKLAIAFVMGIPIEALYPCSNRPLDPEVERIARQIFRLREMDQFDDGYCSRGGPVTGNGW